MNTSNNSHRALTSEVVNYLIYRYLQESGFTHTAFTFGSESAVTKINIDPNNVPPGSLVTFIQKGLQYLEMEANVDAEGEIEGEYQMISPEELITNDIDQLRQFIQDRKDAERSRGNNVSERKRKKEDREREKDREKDREKERMKAIKAEPVQEKVSTLGPSDALGNGSAVSSSLATNGTQQSLEVPPSAVQTLCGHESEVYICAWSPVESLLASGAGDATARIWDLTGSSSGGAASQGFGRATTLVHEVKQDKDRDLTALDWNSDGSLLATGSYDGVARVWGKDGTLRQTFDRHQEPIFALKWNRRGDLLLSGSVDKTAIVWDAKTGDAKQVYRLHSAPTLDVDWRNNSSFATCSTDCSIHVCRLGEKLPIRTFQGHENEINAIRWDPSGRLLASCSDDRTAKIWSLQSDRCLYDLRDHQKEIYTIKWSPTGPGSANPSLPLLLATASFDTTVRLWDAELGRSVHCLRKHEETVYSVAFSPDGRFLASGSFDKALYVWSVRDGTLVKSFHGGGGIYEVCWNKDGNKIAACFSHNVVCVVDLRL